MKIRAVGAFMHGRAGFAPGIVYSVPERFGVFFAKAYGAEILLDDNPAPFVPVPEDVLAEVAIPATIAAAPVLQPDDVLSKAGG